MKVQNITDLSAFFNAVDECNGSVYLVSAEGDRINLKSKLTQYVAIANMLSDGYIRELELVVEQSSDVDRLIKYMIQGE